MSSNEIIRVSDFEIHLEKSTRAKHILLKQNPKGEIVLICPRLCPKMMAVRFAKTQIPWIQAHLQYAPKEQVFKSGDTITLLGNNYTLQSGKLTEIQGDQLIISGRPEFFHRRVCSYAQKVLLNHVQQQVALLTKKLNVQAGRITLRNTSSRWGSCSSTHNLSFCWKIAFAPVDVIDYLVAHEVAHLVQLNHSPKFWALVDELTPYRAASERWLKKNGRKLQSIR